MDLSLEKGPVVLILERSGPCGGQGFQAYMRKADWVCDETAMFSDYCAS